MPFFAGNARRGRPVSTSHKRLRVPKTPSVPLSGLKANWRGTPPSIPNDESVVSIVFDGGTISRRVPPFESQIGWMNPVSDQCQIPGWFARFRLEESSVLELPKEVTTSNNVIQSVICDYFSGS